MPVVSTPVASATGARFSSLFGRRLARAGAVFAAGMGIAAGMSVAGGGIASAGPVMCVSPPSDNDIQVSETASCGAKATDAGYARASAIESGTAVSVANGEGSMTTTYANGFGTSLGTSTSSGQAYAISLGGGIARASASDGATTVAIAGWGSGATVDSTGVDCVGALSFAFNLDTGQFCAMR
ncbi:hypothetical protein BFN03_13070 [Rhodococcus sp. WMMA185]|uniref:DUF6764 family protein n=1 Tax=Rhodococcus sp. WMMA185 TaxID=679318 RepID=UPI000878E057|nr:DUF6764 family protein [Rhodococcus sp. WMMA185]AOW93268.1 hypothetical protein BFN03_13070 [Rhodococcus sp. WMMA185]